ncbi:hypothetical protein [uncultured Marinobacter sp.]|uniref:hypothetical protein n=1 Tax=uncultured Marinobacter sp. TaxID=187379 RepID=UPI0030DD4C12
MSKGEIIEHIGDGRYRIKQLYDVERVKRQRDRVLERLAELAVTLPERQLELLLKEQERDSVATQIDILIPSLRTEPETVRDTITALQVSLVRLGAEAQLLRRQVAELIAEDLGLRKRLNQIDDIPESEEITAWCADLTLDLSGEVAVVDVNDEGRQGTIVAPGFSDAAAHSAAAGALVPREAQSGKQVYFNAAILPGVQKWRPRYRVGTIQAIRGELCSVNLDSASSSAQGLDINQAQLLTDVPIQYMDCDEDAFEEGDRVLVRFFASGPQVIGFESNPRACNRAGIFFVPAILQPNGSRGVFGEPFEDEAGDPVNPPLGTPGGINSAWIATPVFRDEPYAISRGVSPQVAGNMNWIGSGGLAVSWHGPSSRFFEFYNEQFVSAWQSSWSPGSAIFFRRKLLIDLADYAATMGVRTVLGASMEVTESYRRLYVVTVSSESLSPVFKLWRVSLSGSFEPIDSVITEIDSFTCPTGTMFVSGFYFNANGAQGVCTLQNYTGEPRSKVYRVDLSVTSGFSVEQVYDREQPGDYPYNTQATSWTINRTSARTNISTSLLSDSVDPQIDLPLYFDCDDQGFFAVLYRRPKITSSDTFNMSTSNGAGTTQHPHPCAGQPVDGGGGNVWPDTFTGAVDERNSVSSNGSVAGQPDQIITSRGEVLATFPFAEHSTTDTTASSYEETAVVDEPCGSYDGSVYTYSVQRVATSRLRSDSPNFLALAINGRDKFVAAGISSVENTFTWERAGNRWVNDLLSSGGPDGQIELYPVGGSSRSRHTVEVFVDGQSVETLELSDETVPISQGSVFPSGNMFLGIDVGLTDDGSNGTQTGGTGPTTTYFPFLPSLPQIFASGITDASSVILQGRRAVSVLARDNDGNSASYQRIDEVGDPAGGLFERPGEPYLMHRLTVA